MRARLLLLAVITGGCAEAGATQVDGGADASDEDAFIAEDAALWQDSSEPPARTFVAPPAFRSGEVIADDGENDVVASATATALFRVETVPGEHVGFFLTYEDTYADVTMSVDRFDGEAANELWYTDGGRGIRTLAVVDAAAPRTYWVRIEAMEASFSGTLRVVRTPYEDGPRCTADCARLLQLPLPLDSTVEGYAVTSGTIMRYQFGRRDLVMFVRNAGRVMAAAGYAPFRAEDFSQWDGETPGTDTGSLRHASHQRGKDVDLSLYGTDGLAPFRSYCTAVSGTGGRACVAGTAMGFDGYANARFYSVFLGTGRVTNGFLDGELIPLVRAGADTLAADDVIPEAMLPLYNDGVRLQHWPNHDNHIHVRVSEAAYPAQGARMIITPVPFEAP